MAKNNEQTERRQLSMYDYFPEWELTEEPFDESEIPDAVFAQEAAEDEEELMSRWDYEAMTKENRKKLLHLAMTVEFFSEGKFKVQAHWRN